MESFKELKDAIRDEKTLRWIDPDPIDGNDTIITYVEDLSDIEDDEDPSGYPILIQYGDGSEAEVFVSEIEILDEHPFPKYVSFEGNEIVNGDNFYSLAPHTIHGVVGYTIKYWNSKAMCNFRENRVHLDNIKIKFTDKLVLKQYIIDNNLDVINFKLIFVE